MSDDALKQVCGRAMADARKNDSPLREDRRNALKYYRGDALGNERKGRSQVISRDVHDVVESVLPSILRVFFAGDTIVEFEPVGVEDESLAMQATDYVNHVVMKDNRGFEIFYTAIKDALLQKDGYIKHWWAVDDAYESKKYTGVPEDVIAILAMDDEVERVDMEGESLGEDGLPLYDIRVRYKRQQGRVKLMAVAPENIIVSPEAMNEDDADFIAHVEIKRVSDLVAMGYDAAQFEDLAETNALALDDIDGLTRRERQGDMRFESELSALDKSLKRVWYAECYVRVDYDGDGIAELRKVCVAGENADVLLANEEIDSVPISKIPCIPEPHVFHSRSLAEDVMDIQDVKTAVLRQVMDNFYLLNNKRPYVDMDKVNEHTINDLLNNAPGAPIRGQGSNAVDYVDQPALGQEPFNVLEYYDTVREQRSGVTRYNQGLDADSLNKTASGISQIMDASQQRQEMLIRIMAETGIRRVFREVLKLIIRHQDKARTIRLRGEWVDVDPRDWNAEMDVNINVGLGTGNKDQMLAHYMQIHQMQVEAMNLQGGMDGPLMNAKAMNKGYARVCENAGIKNPEAYFPDPATYQPPAPAMAPQIVPDSFDFSQGQQPPMTPQTPVMGTA
jgi:hypothetical protein